MHEPSPPYRTLGFYRFVLAVAVVCGHASWLTADGRNPVASLLGARNAVLLFFVLSGFVLSEAAATYYRGRPHAFAANRALKILPGFVAALVVSILIHAAVAADGRMLQGLAFERYIQPPPQMWRAGNLLINFLSILPFVHIDVGKVFLGDGLYLFVRYIWAVNVELLFYGCVFAAIVARSKRDAAHWILPASVALVAIYVSKDYYIYAPFFLLGALLWYSEHSRHWAMTASLALSAVAIAVSPVVTGKSALIIAIYVGLMVVCSRLRIPRRWQVIDSRLGDLSYAVYLNHFPVLVAFGAYVEGRGLHLWLAAIAASIALAAVVHFVVERPLARVRASIRLQSAQASAPQLK